MTWKAIIQNPVLVFALLAAAAAPIAAVVRNPLVTAGIASCVAIGGVLTSFQTRSRSSLRDEGLLPPKAP